MSFGSPVRVRVSERGVPTLLATALVAAVAVLAFLTIDAPDAIWHPQLTDHPGFAPIDPNAVQELWPSVGTTVGLAAKATAMQAAALDAIGLGQAVDPVWLIALLVVVMTSVIARNVAGNLVAGAAVALALAFGALFSSRAAAAQPIMYGSLLALATIFIALWWIDGRRPLASGLCAATYAAAVAFHPSALVALPALLLATWRAGGRTRQAGLATAAMLIAAALAGIVAFWWLVGGVASVGEWLAPQGMRTVDGRIAGLLDTLAGEFGVLGLGFIALGVATLIADHRRALILLAGWSAAGVVWSLVFASPDWRTSLLPAIAPTWVVAGAGMARMIRMSDDRFARTCIVLLVMLLPALNLLANSHTAARTRATRAFVQRYVAQLERVAPESRIVLAEGGPVDRSIVKRSGIRGVRTWRRVPQDPFEVRKLLEQGVAIVGFPRARSNLEELGVRFSPIADAGVPMSLDEFLRTIPDGWILAAGTTDRLGRASGTLEAFRTVGARASTGGSSVRYGLIAVKGRSNHALERASQAAVDLSVVAGDALPDGSRAPIALRVSSTATGTIIEAGGERVAEITRGLALAVVSPTGELAGAFSTESGDGLLVNPPGLAPAYVAGVEPCAAVPSDRWADVAVPAAATSIGAVVHSNETLVLYLGSRTPLDPRPERLPHRYVPRVMVQSYRTSDDDDASSLRAALARDDTSAPVELDEWAYVSRVEAASPPGGRSQLALRLGGFVEAAFARQTAGRSTADTFVCSTAHTTARLFAATDDALAVDLDLDDDDSFVFGWDSVERTGARQFRWTLAPEAGLFVTLAQPVDLQIEITATAAAGSGTMLLRVNDDELPVVSLQPGERVHRWTVPAAAWASGLNRVSLQVSDLVRAVDLGAREDERLLGMAVARIRLVRTGPG